MGIHFFFLVNHENVITLVELANNYDVALIPYGGGTSVSGAVTLPKHEKRCIVSVDTSQMVIIDFNRVKWMFGIGDIFIAIEMV